MTATCRLHTADGKRCNHNLTLGSTFTLEQATHRIKQWCIEGKRIADVPGGKADHMVRGTCALPHGLGKEIRVLVFAKGEKVKEAEDAGADFVGGEEFSQQIQGGWLGFDRCMATPDMMAVVGKIGKILGPRGLMPNPKVGTVTFDVGAVVQSIKSGQVEFRVDKAGNLHAPVGKISFAPKKLEENVSALVDAVKRLKPSTSKGIYLRGYTISSSMGPGLKVDPQVA